MYAPNPRPNHHLPQPDLSVTEHRAPIAIPRDGSFFQGWGPKI